MTRLVHCVLASMWFSANSLNIAVLGLLSMNIVGMLVALGEFPAGKSFSERRPVSTAMLRPRLLDIEVMLGWLPYVLRRACGAESSTQEVPLPGCAY